MILILIFVRYTNMFMNKSAHLKPSPSYRVFAASNIVRNVLRKLHSKGVCTCTPTYPFRKKTHIFCVAVSLPLFCFMSVVLILVPLRI